MSVYYRPRLQGFGQMSMADGGLDAAAFTQAVTGAVFNAGALATHRAPAYESGTHRAPAYDSGSIIAQFDPTQFMSSSIAGGIAPTGPSTLPGVSAGSGSGSGGSADPNASFRNACTKVNGAYNPTGPTCKLPNGAVMGLKNGQPACISGCQQPGGGAVLPDLYRDTQGAPAGSAGGGAAVAAVGGLAALALLLLR